MSHGKRSSTREYEQMTRKAGTCPSCGKIRYVDRASAKQVIRRMLRREGRLQAYRCGEWWHVGHPPGALARGEISRDEVRPRRMA